MSGPQEACFSYQCKVSLFSVSLVSRVNDRDDGNGTNAISRVKLKL